MNELEIAFQTEGSEDPFIEDPYPLRDPIDRSQA
jgi:hypothetical protein